MPSLGLGELKEFVTEGRSLVITRDGERNDRPPRKPSKRSRVPALVNYFGNVGIGDGEAKQDKSLHVEIGGDYAGDDEAVGGYWLADFADHRNEEVRGEYFSERLKTCRRGIDLRISWRAGWRWIGHAWLDRAAKLFYAEHQEFIKRGVGYLLRDRRTENKLTRPLLLYEEPSWTQRCKIKRKGCQCIGCRPTKDAPAYYAIAHEAKFRTYHRLDNAAYVSDEERNRQQDDWPEWKRKRQRGPAPQWKLTLRAKLKLEHSRMFWPYDELKDYEIWSEPSYSRGLYESYFRPYRVPRLTATHRLPNKISAPYWSKVKLEKWVRFQHSPSLIGESDYGWKDVGFCLVTWAFLGHSHKLPKEMVGQEIVLHKQRKRDIRQYLKPDSTRTSNHSVALHPLLVTTGEGT